MLTRRELAGATHMVALGLRSAAVEVEDMHRTVVRRAWPPAAGPARALHDALASGVYATVRAALGVVATGSRHLAQRPSPSPPSGGQGWRRVVAAVNGAFGDHLAAHASPLAARMSIRRSGQDIDVGEVAPRGRVALLLHGLCENDESWCSDGGPSDYVVALERSGWTPLVLRYNSGLHVSDNGRALADLLDRVTAAGDVTQLALIGHSMGGLVVRSCLAHGEREGAAWTPLVRHAVYLGTPHRGAPLERGAHSAAVALRALPETRPIGAALGWRSVGIKDLRHGYVLPEDWNAQDQDDVDADLGQDVPLLPSATHWVVTASLTADPRHLLGRWVGDLLVLRPSGVGAATPRRASAFRHAGELHLGRAHHFTLLRSPVVARQLAGWLA